jgi:hypothetical protein
MSYGINGVYDTSTNNGMNTGDDYFPNHHYHPHTTKAYSNGFHNSSKINAHNRLDDIEDEHEQQIIDDNYEVDDTDKPKLLMWGLTKYKILFKILFLCIFIKFKKR